MTAAGGERLDDQQQTQPAVQPAGAGDWPTRPPVALGSEFDRSDFASDALSPALPYGEPYRPLPPPYLPPALYAEHPGYDALPPPQIVYVPVPVQRLTRDLPWGLVFSAMFSASTLIAFFALPFVDVVIIINYSAVQITQLASSTQFQWFTAGAGILAFLWGLAGLSRNLAIRPCASGLASPSSCSR